MAQEHQPRLVQSWSADPVWLSHRSEGTVAPRNRRRCSPPRQQCFSAARCTVPLPSDAKYSFA